MKKTYLAALATGLLVGGGFIGVQVSNATILSYDLGYTFSGTAPEGSLSATIDDSGTDTVVITLDASNLVAPKYVNGKLVDGEKVGSWYFNLNPIYTTAQWTSVTLDTTANVDSWSFSPNSYKADGENALFDFVFNFDTSDPNILTGGEKFSVTFNGTALTASDFNFFNYDPKKPASGSYIMAAHVQSIGTNGDSGWVATTTPVPEPATMLLFGTGLAGLAAVARRRKN